MRNRSVLAAVLASALLMLPAFAQHPPKPATIDSTNMTVVPAGGTTPETVGTAAATANAAAGAASAAQATANSAAAAVGTETSRAEAAEASATSAASAAQSTANSASTAAGAAQSTANSAAAAASAAQSTANSATSAASAAQATANAAATQSALSTEATTARAAEAAASNAAAAAQTTANAALPAAGGSLSGTIAGGTLNGTNVSAAVATATGATAARSEAARASDRFSILDFGAKCDGTTDDSAAITAAMATGKTISIPSGLTCYGASISQAGITTMFVGPGQIKTSDGNLRAPIVSQISVRPNVGNWGAVTTAFNGNLSHVPYAIEQRITGTATLGQPTTGWSLTQEVAAIALYGYNASGWNNSLSSNVGRTGAGVIYLDVGQNGQGDYTGITCYGLVSSSLAGATSYLASPAVECMGGELFGGAAGSYIEYLGDMDIADNGFDIAAVGEVFGLARTNATGNLGANWVGSIINSVGTVPINQFQSLGGPSVIGVNWTQENLSYATLAAYSVDGAGTGYTVGDILTSTAANAIAPTQIKVTSLGASNSIAGFSIVKSGIYTAVPAPGDTYPTGGTGSGFKFWASYAANNALLMPAGGCIRGSASNAANPAQTVVSLNDSVCFTTSGITIGTDGSNNMSGPAGANNTLIGSNSWALGKGTVGLGYGVYDDAQYNALLFSSGEFNYSAGTSQTSTRILRGVPTGTGAVRLTSDGNTAGSQNSYLVVAGSAHGLDIHVQAIDETNGDTAVWKWLDGEISRTSSGNATYQGDATTAMTPTYSTGAGGTATIQISADTTYQSLNVTFTPPTSNAHTWHVQAVVRGDKVM